MARRRGIDEQPGRLPEIRAEGGSVTFEFGPVGGEQGTRLVIRCDEAGDVWARLASVADPPE